VYNWFVVGNSSILNGFGNGKMQALRKTKLQVAHPIQNEESNSSIKSYSGSGIRVAKYEGFD
jgi:hypothetical protein